MSAWRLGAAMVLFVAAAWAGRPARNVILFGWDGAQREHVNQCLARGDLPTLAKLIESGRYVEIDIEGATDTKAGWTQILSGYYPEVTGVYHNGRYRPIPVGLTVFERLERHFGPERFATLAVIGKKGHVDADAPRKTRVDEERPRRRKNRKKRPEGRIVEEDGVRYRVVEGKPWYLTQKSMDLFENGLKLDEVVGARAMEVIEAEKDRPFFLFVHFAEVDHSGHKHGENSKEYNDALISNDLWTGRVLARLEELGLADETLVYVTADHGFDEGGKAHRNAPHVFLATNDLRVMRNGLRQDVAPTVLEAFGIDPSEFEPSLDGVSLARPHRRESVKLGPQPGLYPRQREPATVLIEAEDPVVAHPGEPEVGGWKIISGRGFLEPMRPEDTCIYEVDLPRPGPYHLWVHHSAKREAQLKLCLDPFSAPVEIEAPLPAAKYFEWTLAWKGRLAQGSHLLAVEGTSARLDCYCVTTVPGPPAIDLAKLPDAPPMDEETRAKLQRSAAPVRPDWLPADRALPAWFDGQRVCAHTRLSPRWREEPLFLTAGKQLGRLGFHVLVRHIKSRSEGAWWPSKAGHVEEWARERNHAKEIIDEAHAAGLRILVYHRHSEDSAAYEEHPDWRMRDPRGIRGLRVRGSGWVCPNSPYGDIVKTRLLELLEMGADGFYFDSIHMLKLGCWCEHCRARFSEQTGLEAPERVYAEDPLFRRYRDFKNESIERVFLDWHRAIHQRNPEAVLIVSSNTYPNMLESHTTHRLYRIADSVKTEFNKGPVRLVGRNDASLSFGWDLARDAADGRPAHVWIHGLPDAPSAVHATAGVIAHGCIANLDQDEKMIPDAETFREAVALGNRVSPHLAGIRPLRWALVHCPDESRHLPYYDRCRVAWSAYGAYRTLLRERLPVAMITDSQLEEGLPARCHVLFVPVPDRLTDPMRKAVAAFRERGGTVIEQRSDWRWDADEETFEYAAGCLRRKLPADAPVRVAGGPRELHASTYASRDGKRIVIALAQDCSWIGVGRRVRAGGPPGPCQGVTVTLPVAPTRVTEAVSGKDLTLAGSSVEVPAFEALAVLVFEFGPERPPR